VADFSAPWSRIKRAAEHAERFRREVDAYIDLPTYERTDQPTERGRSNAYHLHDGTQWARAYDVDSATCARHVQADSDQGVSGGQRDLEGYMRRVISLLLAGIMILTTAGVASADSFHHPKPPKCVPANTPGCS
jgi:hypothetical protein